jgi:hypothetical protein
LTVSVNRTVFVASIENIVTGRVVLSDYGKKNLLITTCTAILAVVDALHFYDAAHFMQP